MTDVLDRIDGAFVGRCPCGTALGPDSPSLDWCSKQHQWSWSQRDAHNPGEVYDRPDADTPPQARFATVTVRLDEEAIRRHLLWRAQQFYGARCVDPRSPFRITGI